MALNIYALNTQWGIQNESRILSDQSYVADIERFWIQSEISIDSEAVRVIKAIDDVDAFYDEIEGWVIPGKFGNVIPVNNISTTAKALILLHLYPDKILNCIELGENGLIYAVENFKCGTIVINFPSVKVSNNASIEISVNTADIVTTGEEYNEWYY